MDENVIEELQFHQQTVQADENTPLHLIREKEMEISGRVLAAKRQADEILADARRDAATLMSTAHEEASAEAGVRDEAVKADMVRQMAEVRANAEIEAAALEKTIEAKTPEAVAAVIDAVLSV